MGEFRVKSRSKVALYEKNAKSVTGYGLPSHSPELPLFMSAKKSFLKPSHDGQKKRGRPRLNNSASVQELRRRQQLRSAQDAYRIRKRDRIIDIENQNSTLRENATNLAQSLVALLDDIFDSDKASGILRQDPDLAERIGNVVRDMLQLTQAMQDLNLSGKEEEALFDVADDNRNRQVVTKALRSSEAVQESNDLSTDEAMELFFSMQDSALPLDETVRAASQYVLPSEDLTSMDIIQAIPAIELRTQFKDSPTDSASYFNTQMAEHHIPTLDNPVSSTKDSNAQIIRVPQPTEKFYDWFTAKYLMLDHNYSLGFYTPIINPEASFTYRLTLSSLMRASWILQSPATDMNLIYEMFPFETNPAPRHQQLIKINHLIVENQRSDGSFDNGLRDTDGNAPWNEIFSAWLSPEQVGNYLEYRWNISTNADNIELKHAGVKKHGHTQLQPMPSDGHDYLQRVSLKVPNLIEGVIQKAICKENSPAFPRSHVDQVVYEMIAVSNIR